MPCQSPTPTSKPLGPPLAQPTGSNRHHHHSLYTLPSRPSIPPILLLSLLIHTYFHHLFPPYYPRILLPYLLFCLPPLPTIMNFLALRRFASSRVSPKSNLYSSTIVRFHVTRTNPSATTCRSRKPVRSTQLDQLVGSLAIAVLIKSQSFSLAIAEIPRFHKASLLTRFLDNSKNIQLRAASRQRSPRPCFLQISCRGMFLAVCFTNSTNFYYFYFLLNSC